MPFSINHLSTSVIPLISTILFQHLLRVVYTLKYSVGT